MELHQRTLLEKRSFFLLSNKLKLHLKDAKGERENYINYESLKGEAKITCRKNSKLLFLAIAMLTFAVCIFLQNLISERGLGFVYVFLPLFLACLSAILYQHRQQDYIVLETCDRRKVVFLRDKPNRQALEIFLARLWLYRRQYLRDKYFYINYDGDFERQTERLKWLLNEKAIARSEYKLAQEDWIIDRSCRR